MLKVFRHPFYFVLAFILALAVFVFLALLPNYRAIFFVFDDSGLDFSSKANFLVYLVLGIAESLSFFSIANTVAVSILFGINVTLVVYLLREKFARLDGRAVVAALSGGGFGVLSAGCAVCGSFVLSAALSIFGAGGALALLPLRGGEFGILSIILLGVSIYIIARKITNSQLTTCNL